MDMIIGIILLTIAILCVYVQFHMERERYEGKSLPLPWEEGGWMNRAKRKIFDKSDIKYRDGDNT